MASKLEKRNDKKNVFLKSKNVGLTNNGEDVECGGIDVEIKNIFDDLRAIGSSQNQTLDEILIKAIAMERESLKEQSENVSGTSSFGKVKAWAANFGQLQLREVMVCLLLTVMALSIMNLPNSFKEANLNEWSQHQK